MEDTVITEKVSQINTGFTCQKTLDKFDGHKLWFKITENEANNEYRNIEEIL
jgi:hypothetical protein